MTVPEDGRPFQSSEGNISTTTGSEGRHDSARRWTSFSVVGRQHIHYSVIMPVFILDDEETAMPAYYLH